MANVPSVGTTLACFGPSFQGPKIGRGLVSAAELGQESAQGQAAPLASFCLRGQAPPLPNNCALHVEKDIRTLLPFL